MSHLKYPRSVNPELHNVNMLALVFTSKLSCIMWKDFLLGLSSSDAWWRWTITALGSTTAVDIQTTPTSPVSYCWPHWAAHMLPSSLLWLCTRSSTKGSVRTIVICIIHLLVYCVNKIPFTLVLTQITSFFFFPLSADIIWLEHRKDWHECRAPVSAHYALQRTRLCCYTLCLRLGTGHHYCCWHAFLYTGTWPSRNSLSELTKLSLTNITSDCWYSFFQMKVILRNKTSIESWIEEKVPTLIYIAAHLFQMLITTLSRAFSRKLSHFNSSPLSTKAKDRIQHYQTGEEFIFPYDLGSRWMNFKRVFTWSGTPTGDGLEWPVHPKCHQHTLTVCLLSRSLLMRLN